MARRACLAFQNGFFIHVNLLQLLMQTQGYVSAEARGASLRGIPSPVVSCRAARAGRTRPGSSARRRGAGTLLLRPLKTPAPRPGGWTPYTAV